VTAQAITLVQPADQLKSAAPFQVQASSSSGLPVSVTVASGPASVSGTTVTLTGGTGPVTLVATQAGNATYSAASPVFVTFNVTSTVMAPVIVAVSPSGSVAAGNTEVFWVAATGTPVLSYAWAFNGTPIPGADGPSYVLASAQASNAGSYSVTVTNTAGTATSSAAVLTVNAAGAGGAAPAVASEPSTVNVSSGGTVILTVNGLQTGSSTTSTKAGGVSTRTAEPNVASYTYQWFKNGNPIAGATDSTYIVKDAAAALGDQYTCLVSNGSGSVLTAPQTVNVINTPNPGRLVDLSCRALVGTGANQLIAGFVVGGQGTSGSEPVLIRASGPALTQFGVTGVLADPDLTLNGPSGVLATNNGWNGNAEVSTDETLVGAFTWTATSSHDSALVETLPGGGYTAQVTGASGDTGVALVEAYDATPLASDTLASPRLINISARTQVGTSGNILIAGFVIGGTTSKTVLIRASGPALAAFGLSGTLRDPQLSLLRSNSDGTSTLLQTNTGWGGDATIAATASSVGAFTWGSTATADSAILVTLAPGAYTAEVTGASGDTGLGLVEVYDVQ
jgi:hypothetical protein